MKIHTRQARAEWAVENARAISSPEAQTYPWVVALRQIPANEVTPERVDAAVGHDSQTRLRCDECGSTSQDAVVEVGEPPDYESATACLCKSCLRAALEFFA